MPSKELIASVIEAIVKNPPKVTRFKDMETLEYSEVVDYTPTAQAVTATILAALQEPTRPMSEIGQPYIRVGYDAWDVWRAMLNASALGKQSDG